MIQTLAAVAIVLQMTNLAQAPPDTVAHARVEVARLFRDVAVDATWIDPAPHGVVAPGVIHVVLIPHAPGDLRARRSRVMGAAVRASERTRVAYVFFRAVEREAERHAVSVAQALAGTIAHEVGHVLLATTEHAGSGLMRATWDREEFCLANQGQLRFLPSQAAPLRAATAAFRK